MKIRERTRRILDKLNQDIQEREEIIGLALLSSIAGESTFMLGPPGVAKSLIARRLKYAFEGEKSFEYLMNRFSTPDEIFGPVSISRLKDEDKYERLTANYLPDATVVFLDEIWKAGPSIQNALLTVLNEKVYRNGDTEMRLEMKGLLSASNELPAKGEGLEALWDRFLVRYYVDNIENYENFVQMIRNTVATDVSLEASLKISNAEYQEWSGVIDEIQLPDEVLNVIHVVRTYISDYNRKRVVAGAGADKGPPLYVSDRRWKKIVRLLRASAFLNDRDAVDLMDCFLAAHCLWCEVEQIELVKEMVTRAIKDHGYSLTFDMKLYRAEIGDLNREVETHTADFKSQLKREKETVDDDFYEIIFDGAVTDKGQHNRISQDVFDELGGSFESIGLFNAGDEVSQEFEACRSDDDTITLRRTGQESPVTLRIATELNEYKTRRPHDVLVNHWDKKIDSLYLKLDVDRKAVEDYKARHMAGLKSNLFVAEGLAEHVEWNLNQTIQAIGSLKLDLDKLKGLYEGL